jgi:hypothetical protein
LSALSSFALCHVVLPTSYLYSSSFVNIAAPVAAVSPDPAQSP